MPKFTLNKVFHSSSSSDTSLLDSAQAGGIALPYSCRSGVCGVCKCRVIRGETLAIREEIGLTETERAEGWILSCVRVGQTDVTLEVDDIGCVVLPTSKTLPCRIHSIERQNPDVIRVMLRLPPTAEFSFIPGQYIDIIGPSGVRRSYSLANASFGDKALELHIRAVERGVMSDYWFKDAKVNDLLRLHGPLGTFFLREYKDLDLVFLATGTGIAPVKAITQSLVGTPPDLAPRSITVFWGGRTIKDLYFDPHEILAGHRFIPVLSRPPLGWAGASGYVQNAFLASQPDLARTAVYACGSHAMICGAKSSLLSAGLPYNRFFSDAFLPSAPQ